MNAALINRNAEMVELYVSGVSSTVLGEKFNISSRQVRRTMVKLGVETRDAGQPRIHSVNEDFFKTWTPEMAYVLGMIASDGCISTFNSFSIAQKEKYILEKISEALSYDTPIITINEKTKCHSLSVNSKKMVKDLMDIGITQRKSLTLEFPNVPNEYMSHFIRGIFDGDGHISRKVAYVSIASGSECFAISLHNILKHNGFNVNIKQNSGIYRIVITTLASVQLFSQWIYKDCGDLYLIRKFETFKKGVKK
jgi:hypothetical protein